MLVVGKVYHDAFVERAEDLGVRQAFLVRGAVPRNDVPAYFAAADIVAHDLNGGCGTASLEAMLSGTPTIVRSAKTITRASIFATATTCSSCHRTTRTPSRRR